jgi:hypothetical protein
MLCRSGTVGALALVLASVSASMPANATVAGVQLTYTLSNPNNFCGNCGPGPYGTVTITQLGGSGSDIQVSVVLGPNETFANSHANDALSFNYSAGALDTSSNAQNQLPSGFVVDGSNNNFPYGIFNFGIHNNNTTSSSPTTLTFDLTDSGLLSASQFAVSTKPSDTHTYFAAFFAADINYTNPITLEEVDPAVGAVAPVPDVSTWSMMIFGFCGVGLLAYRRKDRLTLRLS